MHISFRIIGIFFFLFMAVFFDFRNSELRFEMLTGVCESYDFIKNNIAYFAELKNSNLFLISIIFLALTILWVFPFLGFGSPVALMGGFIFGKWIGTLLSLIHI